MTIRNFLLSIVLLVGNQEVGFAAETNYLGEWPPYAGVWVNTFGKAYDFSPYHQFLAGEAGRLMWPNLQTGPDTYDFTEIERVLRRVQAAGQYWYCELWTGHKWAPDWLFSHGVPRVYDQSGDLYPYYLDARYRNYLTGFFNALATYIARLPEDLRKRVAFIQPGFGSTGDRQLYKETLQDPQYHSRTICLVKVVADDGRYGWGEGYGPALVVKAGIELLKPLVLGRDPLATSALWQTL